MAPIKESFDPESDAKSSPTSRGLGVIADQLPTLPMAPGVYRMLNGNGDALYVGKAKDLRKRVTSYTNLSRMSGRLLRMIAETATLEVITTNTEVEALLLESNLIKKLKPRYNILLRDDKSFPSILLRFDHDFPQVLKHRGAQGRDGDYFGPFASAWAVNRTLTALQRAFLLRSCSDSVFSARTRPCLLYQIKRCSAPCVGRVDREEYAALVKEARLFLTGDSQSSQRRLAERMEAASQALDFETAARYRDRIRALTAVQSHQEVNLRGIGDADVIAAHTAGGTTCVQVFFFRAGCNHGNRAFYPDHRGEEDTAVVLEAFMGQFYADRQAPSSILVSHDLPQRDLLAEALSVRSGRRVRIAAPVRGDKRHLVENALTNAKEALSRRLAESSTQRKLLDGLAQLLSLEATPERIEIYDNSHVSGKDAVGAMVVAGPEGFVKNAYRKFTIRNADPNSPGDDYAMMREVLSRRFTRALREDPERAQGQWPDLVLIDGGAGQLSAAMDTLAELGVDDVVVAAIAKGPDRDAGRERIFLPGRSPISPERRDSVLYFLQRLRDEAHRFAIGAHRDKRSAAIKRSGLDDIPGIGGKRKKALLHHFGSAKAVGHAARADLLAVPGISEAIANRIYEWFHPTQ
jgi:excinuclease ABC subunit C